MESRQSLRILLLSGLARSPAGLLSRSHSLTHTRSLPPSHTHSLTLSLFHTPSLTLTHSHTLSLTHSLTHSISLSDRPDHPRVSTSSGGKTKSTSYSSHFPLAVTRIRGAGRVNPSSENRRVALSARVGATKPHSRAFQFSLKVTFKSQFSLRNMSKVATIGPKSGRSRLERLGEFSSGMPSSGNRGGFRRNCGAACGCYY